MTCGEACTKNPRQILKKGSLELKSQNYLFIAPTFILRSLQYLIAYKIGGCAEYFFRAASVQELKDAVRLAREKGLKVFVLGGGTNLLIGDEGVRGLVLRPFLYWLGELYYQKRDFLAAIGWYRKFLEEPGSFGMSQHNQAFYNINCSS